MLNLLAVSHSDSAQKQLRFSASGSAAACINLERQLRANTTAASLPRCARNYAVRQNASRPAAAHKEEIDPARHCISLRPRTIAATAATAGG